MLKMTHCNQRQHVHEEFMNYFLVSRLFLWKGKEIPTNPKTLNQCYESDVNDLVRIHPINGWK